MGGTAAEPPVGSIVRDSEGDLWIRDETGWCNVTPGVDRTTWEFLTVNCGPAERVGGQVTSAEPSGFAIRALALTTAERSIPVTGQPGQPGPGDLLAAARLYEGYLRGEGTDG